MNEIKPILTPKKDNFNLCVFGKKGSGKTSWIRGLIQPVKRLFIMDTLGYEYTEADGEIIESYFVLCKRLLELQNLSTDSFRFILRNAEEADKLFVMWWKMTNVTLLIEETDKFCDLHNIDPSILEHMSRGRHNENNLIAVSRFPQEINPRIRQGCDTIISFRQKESNIIKVLSETNSELAAKLPDLKKSSGGRTVEGENYLILMGEDYLQQFLERQGKENENL